MPDEDLRAETKRADAAAEHRSLWDAIWPRRRNIIDLEVASDRLTRAAANLKEALALRAAAASVSNASEAANLKARAEALLQEANRLKVAGQVLLEG